jgi:hypothetical protein
MLGDACGCASANKGHDTEIQTICPWRYPFAKSDRKDVATPQHRAENVLSPLDRFADINLNLQGA